MARRKNTQDVPGSEPVADEPKGEAPEAPEAPKEEAPAEMEIAQPPAEAVADAVFPDDTGLIADAPAPDAGLPPVPDFGVPTVAELTEHFLFGAKAAERIVAALSKAAKVLSEETGKRDLLLGVNAGRPHYLVSSPLPRGYMKIGRRFGKEPTPLFLDDLTPAEIDELEKAQAAHVFVERVGFEKRKA